MYKNPEFCRFLNLLVFLVRCIRTLLGNLHGFYIHIVIILFKNNTYSIHSYLLENSGNPSKLLYKHVYI